MALTDEVRSVLAQFGVGKRSPDDPFLAGNKILAEASERIAVLQIDTSSAEKLTGIQCAVPGCRGQFGKLFEYEAHYNSAHRYTCCECKRNLPSAHLLDLHVAEAHDCFFAVLAEREPSYRCFVDACTIKFKDPKERKDHCLKLHSFPPHFRFDTANTNANVRTKKGNEAKNAKKFKEKVVEDSEEKMDCDTSVGKDAKTGPERLKTFNFGHSKRKAFVSKKSSILQSDDFMSDLKSSLPE